MEMKIPIVFDPLKVLIGSFSSLFANPFSCHLEPDASKARSKKGAAPSAPQWRKQAREVLSSNALSLLFIPSFFFLSLENAKTTICI